MLMREKLRDKRYKWDALPQRLCSDPIPKNLRYGRVGIDFGASKPEPTLFAGFFLTYAKHELALVDPLGELDLGIMLCATPCGNIPWGPIQFLKGELHRYDRDARVLAG